MSASKRRALSASSVADILVPVLPVIADFAEFEDVLALRTVLDAELYLCHSLNIRYSDMPYVKSAYIPRVKTFRVPVGEMAYVSMRNDELVARTSAAQVHLVDFDIVKQFSDPIWENVGERDLDRAYHVLLQRMVLDKALAFIRARYPTFERMVQHGDILQDNTAGYRTNGVYFITTYPELRIIYKDRSLDAYGAIPVQFHVITTFPIDHWALSRMSIVDHSLINGGRPLTCKFSWHGGNDMCCAYIGLDVRIIESPYHTHLKYKKGDKEYKYNVRGRILRPRMGRQGVDLNIVEEITTKTPS